MREKSVCCGKGKNKESDFSVQLKCKMDFLSYICVTKLEIHRVEPSKQAHARALLTLINKEWKRKEKLTSSFEFGGCCGCCCYCEFPNKKAFTLLRLVIPLAKCRTHFSAFTVGQANIHFQIGINHKKHRKNF